MVVTIIKTIDRRIRLYIEGKYLCDRLSINEWNALFMRYQHDPNSTIIDHFDESKYDTVYAIIETTLGTVLSKNAIMDLQFLHAVDGKKEIVSEMSCDTMKELEEIVIDWIKNWKFAKI